MLDLSELVLRCQQGDALAWEAIVRQLQGRVYALVFGYHPHREEAADMAQEVFVRVFESIGSCRNPAAFKAWVLAMARNVCIDRIRKKKARPQAGADVAKLALEDQRPDPETSLQLDRRKRLIYQALAELSETSREMILLKEIQGLKQSEIAAMLNLPEGTVKSRSGRARVELAKAVLKIDPHFEPRLAT